MSSEILLPLIGLSASIAVMGTMLIGVIDLLGKLYVTYDILRRNDLSSEQILIFLLLVWLLPAVWAIYLLIGRKRTGELFSSIET